MKIVICGNYGAGNLGDEMILEGLLDLLQEITPKAQITVLSGNPSETNERHGYDAVPHFPSGIRSSIKSLFYKSPTDQALQQADFFILGGGGLFAGPEYRANRIWGKQVEAAQKYGVPIIFLGQSLGNISNRRLIHFLAPIFNSAHFIGVRDQLSCQILQKIGVDQHIHITPDLALRLDHHIQVSREAEIIVALRQMKNLDQNFIATISDFLNWLIENKKWRIKFIDFHKNDSALHQKVIANIRQADQINHIKKIKNSTQLFAIYSKASMVLGMRLHSIITAYKTNTPFIAISYAPKVKAFLEDINQQETMLQLTNLTSKNLQEAFQVAKEMNITQKFENFNWRHITKAFRE